MIRSMMGKKKGLYIIKDGVLMDQGLAVTTAKYGAQWSSTDNRKLEYRNGYIYFYGSCKNRSSGIVFKPRIVNKGYSRLVIEADIKYDGKYHGGVILGTTYGSESSWIRDAMLPTGEGRKYCDDPSPIATNKFQLEIRGVTNLFVFIGMVSIANPDMGCVVNLYNMYLTR